MEYDILDSLEDLGYNGPLKDETEFQNAIEGGPKSIEYTHLVEWLTKELKGLCKLEDHVNAINNPDDSSSFLLEVSSFLKELYCPYSSLTEGNLNQRLLSKESRLQLLDFLTSELQAARMVSLNKPDTPKGMQIEVDESSTAADLKAMLITLHFPKPPANITASQLFTKVEGKVKDVVSKLPAKLIGKPLFNGVLSDKQWHILQSIDTELHKEYTLRREMLLKRLDVTIQSFKWSSVAKTKENEIMAVYQPKRQLLTIEPKISLAHILAAREDILIIEKTSDSSVRKNTQSAINKVLIGKVPDRGGRPNEQRPPPPEMPSWQKRTDSSSSGHQGSGRGGGGGSGDRGDRVQSGWSGERRGHSGRGGTGKGGGGGNRDDRGYGGPPPVAAYSAQQSYDLGPLHFAGAQPMPPMNFPIAYQPNYDSGRRGGDGGYQQDSYRGKDNRHRGGRGGRGGRGRNQQQYVDNSYMDGGQYQQYQQPQYFQGNNYQYSGYSR